MRGTDGEQLRGVHHACGLILALCLVMSAEIVGRCQPPTVSKAQGKRRSEIEPQGRRRARAPSDTRHVGSLEFTAGAWLEDGKSIVVAIEGKGLVEIQLLGKLLRSRLVAEDATFVKLLRPRAGGRIIGITWNGRVYVWEPGTGSVKKWRTTIRSASSACLWGSKENLAIGSWCGTVQTLRADGTLVQELRGHRGAVLDVAGCENTETIATSGKDGKVILWDAVTGERKGSLDLGACVGGVAMWEGGQRLLAGTYQGTCTLWDVARKKVIRSYRPSRPIAVRGFAIGDDWYAARGLFDYCIWSSASSSLWYAPRSVVFGNRHVAIEASEGYCLVLTDREVCVMDVKSFVCVFQMWVTEVVRKL